MKHTARILLAVALVLMLSASAWAFTDTAALNSAEQAALDKLSGLTVVNGYPDGSFKPTATVTRAEFAKMLCVFAAKTELLSAAPAFSDVAAGAWYYGWVSRAVNEGWINGYPGGEYRPNNTITQQEIATVLVRLSGVDTKNFVWPGDYNETARAAGMLKDFSFAGGANASRIVACQMFYNALPDQQPVDTTVVRGVVTELSSGSVTISDGKDKSATYTVAGNLLPDKLIVGSYLELEVAGKNAVKVVESINAKKGTAYWDIALDGKSAVINDKKYDISEADIFVVEYTLNKTYSTDTFVKGSTVDRDILSLGGRLAAEMAVVVEESGSKLKTAYLVNASIIVSGGRLDVVDGNYSSSKGTGIYLLGRDAGLPVADSFKGTLPSQGEFVHYTLRNGEITGCETLFNMNTWVVTKTDSILKSSNEDDPYAWVDETGKANSTTFAGTIMSGLDLPVVLAINRNTVQLGTGGDYNNYFLAEGCLFYEIKNDEIKQGSRSGIDKDDSVLALVNRVDEICYLLYFKK